MKKCFAIFPTLALLLLTACGPAAPVSSDLTTEAQRQEVRSVMEGAGLSNVDTFFSWVEEYNEAAAADTFLDSDTNCRLTAFLLLQGLVESNPVTDYGTYLMMDVDALDRDPRYELLKDQKGTFISLFNQVSVAEKTEDYLQAFPKAWEERGVHFPEGKVSLVSVVMNDSGEQCLFIGHTGVLIEGEKTLWFIEKLAPDKPYRATKYADRGALAAALLGRAEYTLGDEDFPTFLLENDRVLQS
ncbi:MAG: DUF4300 family protein [Oscillospiraceae bacterium]